MSRPSWQQTPPEAPPEPKERRGCSRMDMNGCCLEELIDTVLSFIRCGNTLLLVACAIAALLALLSAAGG